MPDLPHLFQPLALGPLALPNRIVMAPLTRSRSSAEGVPPSFAADYYAQRAAAGLIISEATNISPQAVGYALTPGIWTEAQVASWTRVTDAVHAAGGRIFLQLWHTGRISHPSLQPDGGLPVSSSAVRPEGEAFTAGGMQPHVTPRALETDEVDAVVGDYGHAARQARRAGFDGVEIHAANNYLLEQFIRDTVNQRSDRYGGSIENRIRFPLAVVDAVVGVWGGDRVGIRLSPATTVPSGAAPDSTPMDTYGALIDGIAARGLAYIHMIEGLTYTSRDVPDAIDLAALRRRFPGRYIANNIYDADFAERAISDGDADLVAFGRPFIANPDLVDRIRTGAPLADAPKQYWYGGDATGYADWPRMTTSPS